MASSAHTDRVDDLVAESLPLVRAIVAGMAAHYPRHCDRDDLVAAGTLGLVEAARRFDADRGVPFERWAALRIRGAVVDAVRALDFAPRSLRASARDLEQVRQALSAQLGRTPLSEELAQRMGLSLAELVTLEGRLHRSTVLSLDAPSHEGADDDATLSSIIMDAAGTDPLEQLEHRERHSYVRDALGLLPERVRAVLVGYFLEGRTSAELAEELGVTESRVSQLRSEGLRTMRDGIAAQYAAIPDAAPTAKLAASAAKQAAFNASLARRSAFGARLTVASSAVPAQRSAPVELTRAG